MTNAAFQPDSAPPSPLHVDQVDMPAGNTYANVTPEALPPIPVGELAAYVEKNKADAAGFKKEYAKIPQGELFRCERGELEENIKKNRFLNIKAYDHTRVVLDKEGDDEYSDYVNANYLTGYKDKEKAYVATQGPRPVTVNDIWRLIWHINTNRIVMVTNLMENGKRKCERYWPEHQGESVDYGHITVTTVSVEEYADYTVSIFNVSKASTGHRQVMHFHFTSWQDKRIPDYAFPLLSFQRRVRSYNSGARGPLLVHCSAGVGRTGTYLALDYLLQQAEAEKQVDVFGYVNLMRTQRMNMIQTLEQYIFVYDALVESIRVGETTVSTAKLPPTYKQWSSKKPGAAMSKLEEQFTILEEFHPHNRDMGKSSALRPENIDKNRFPEIYASDMCRPYLSTRVEDGTDYINATFVGSYHSRDALLATQAPLPNTVADIWRLVNDHSANCIVMLNEEKDMDETCGVYWPSEEESSITFDLMTITQTECNTEHPNILVRDMTLVHNSDPEIPVRQFVLHDVWPADCELPDPGVMCDLVDQIEKWQQTYGKGKHKVIIHCMNGVDRTGLLCACLNIIEKLRVEQEVDIFTSVKHIKKSWTDFISTEAQYKFLYEMVQTYILRYDTYANFK